EGMRGGDDLRDLGHRVRAIVDGFDEWASDLQGLHRQFREVGERRIAGAKVVDREGDAELAHRVELFDVRLDVLHQQAFGNFQVNAVLFAANGLLYERDELAVAQLDRRDVHRDARRLQDVFHE